MWCWVAWDEDTHAPPQYLTISTHGRAIACARNSYSVRSAAPPSQAARSVYQQLDTRDCQPGSRTVLLVRLSYGLAHGHIRSMAEQTTVHILAIAAHRDDVELTCGGTLIKAAKLSQRTAILDLTQGEMGTRGSAALRKEEADRAAEIIGVSVRETLGLPDAGIENTPATREALARVIRRLAPRVVIAPALEGRHPDHRITAQLVRDACFVAGLAKVAPDTPKHRPHKIVHTLAYRQDFVRPTFVVDISDEFEQKMQAVRCYASQFDGALQAGEVYPTGEPLYDVVTHYAATYGSLIRARYGEPFFTTEMMRVDDIGSLEVSTF